MPTTTPDLSGLTAFLQERGLPLLIILVVTLVAFRAMRPLAHRLITRVLQDRAARRAAAVDVDAEVAKLMAEESLKRVTTLEDLVATILKVTVLIVASLVILTVLDLLPVIAGLGLLAVALTLAGQSIVLDYLMGILIVLEGPYYKGDWVQIGGVEGEVEEVGMRRTVVRDSTGTVHSISNGEARIASNLTRLFARMLVDATIAYDTDIDRATAIVNDVGAAMFADPAWSSRLLEAPYLLRVDALGELGMTLRVAGRVRASDRFVAPGELRKRLLAAFQANGIEIAVRGRMVLARDPGMAAAAAGEPTSGTDDAGSAGARDA
jgi:small conductance mechanosensitive channel